MRQSIHIQKEIITGIIRGCKFSDQLMNCERMIETYKVKFDHENNDVCKSMVEDLYYIVMIRRDELYSIELP